MPSNIANEIQRYISDIFSKYYDLLFFNVKIRDSISRLYNNSREHSNKAFIVLIVGPVKSGKSTLVNLIANSYVSPTDFIECTVRPSIISKKNENETPAIEVFVSKHNNNEHSGEQVDQIIDNLRGLISKEDIDGVTQRSFDLTNDNISRYVSLKLLDAKQDNTLMTSIRTHGGNLLKDLGTFSPDYLVVNIATPTFKEDMEAVALAKHIDGEIISADSRQLYRRMDLGTGKDLDEYG